jgi:hypothetical protein
VRSSSPLKEFSILGPRSWLSDVIGGLAVGTTLLNVVILIASGFGPSPRFSPSADRTAPAAPPLPWR